MKKQRFAFVVVLAALLSVLVAFAVGCQSGKTAEKIELNTDGCRTVFYLDETFTADGLVVTAYYTDGSTGNVELKDCTISSPNMNVEGEKTIRVKYGELTESYKITVTKKPIEWEADFTVDPVGGEKHYELSALDAHLAAIGSTLGPSAEHPDLSIGGIVEGDRISFRIDAKSGGIAELYLDYDHTSQGGANVSDMFKITLDDADIDTDAKLNAGANNHTHTQWYCFQKTRIAQFDLPQGHHILTFESRGNGSNFKGISLDYKILDAISLDTTSVKKQFRSDEAFNADGLVVTAKYLNDITETLTADDYTVQAPDMTEIGEKTVTVKYGGKTQEYTIEVVENTATLTGITVDTADAQTEYYCGKAFKSTGVKVQATFDDGYEMFVTSDKVKFTKPSDMVEPGEKTVTVAYGDKTATYTINVTPAFAADPADEIGKFTFAAVDAALGKGIKTYKAHNDVGNIVAINKPSITFYFTSTADGVARLLFNYDHNIQGLIKNHMDVLVNGVKLETENKFATPSINHSHTAAHCYTAPTFIGAVSVKQGFNNIEFKFKSDGTNLKNISLDFGDEEEDPNAPKEYVFEAENALLSRCMAETNTTSGASGNANVGSTVPDDPDTEEFDGSLCTFRVYAAADVTVSAVIRLSSGTATTLDQLVGLMTVNGDPVDLSNIQVPAGAPNGTMWFIWTTATVENIRLHEGLNIIEVSPIANFDCMIFTSTVKLTEKLESEKFYMIDGGYALRPSNVQPVDKHDGWLNGIMQNDEISFTVHTDTATTAIISFFMDHGPDNFGNGPADNQAFPFCSTLYEFTLEHNDDIAAFVSHLKFPYCLHKGACSYGGFHDLEAKLGMINLEAGDTTITVKFLKESISNFHGIGFYSTEPITGVRPEDPVKPEDPDKPPAEKTFTFEAEKALRYACSADFTAGAFASGGAAVGSVDVEDDPETEQFDGSLVTFRIYAAEEVATNVNLRLHSATATTLDTLVRLIKINGVTVENLSDITVQAGSSSSAWHMYTDCILENVTLNKGLNIIEVSPKVNFDCIKIKTTVELSETAEGESFYMFDGASAVCPETVKPVAGHDGWVNGIKKNDEISFTVHTDNAVTTMLSFFIDHGNDNYGDGFFPLYSGLYEITYTHNGESKKVVCDPKFPYCTAYDSEGGFHDIEVKLALIDLEAGDTTITVKFLKDSVSNFHGIGMYSTETLTAVAPQAPVVPDPGQTTEPETQRLA